MGDKHTCVELSAGSLNYSSGYVDPVRDGVAGSFIKTDSLLTTLETEKKSTDLSQKEPEEDITPDDILHQLGGCGTFQILLVAIVHAMKMVVCWSMMGTAFFAFTPRWRCTEDASNQTIDGLGAALAESDSGNEIMIVGNTSEVIWNEQCTTATGKACTMFEFEAGTRTLVTEFSLVCDQSWVPATITSLQMLGMCVGSVLSGQLADLFGRKVPLFSSMVLLFVFHLMSFFATSWVMLGVARVFIGIGCAFYVAICYTICVEFSLSKWRAVVTGLPSWAIESSAFALVAWLLRDWKHVTLVMIIISLVSLSAWFVRETIDLGSNSLDPDETPGYSASHPDQSCLHIPPHSGIGREWIKWQLVYVPESFRWYITHNKYDEAEAVVNSISRVNKHPAPDFQRMRNAISKQEAEIRTKKYSVLVLFRRLALLKITVPLSIVWCSMGMITYGINFAIQKLSGDIYLNIFLFSIASIPSKFISIYLQNRFGRRKAAWAAFSVCLVGGLVVGITQYIDTPYRDSLTNYCALAASVGVDGTWGPMQTHTLELYPTVVRNTGFGFVSILARVGAIIGPQFVYLSEMVPGLLFFIVAVMSVLSIFGTCTLPETSNTTMVDRLGDKYTRKTEDY